MELKPGVDATDVSRVLWMYLGAVASLHRSWTGVGLVVTSLHRPHGKHYSKHSPPPGGLVAAADLRRWALDAKGVTITFCRMLQQVFGPMLGVVLEPEWLTPEELASRGGLARVKPHIHVELERTGWPDEL